MQVGHMCSCPTCIGCAGASTRHWCKFSSPDPRQPKRPRTRADTVQEPRPAAVPRRGRYSGGQPFDSHGQKPMPMAVAVLMSVL